MTITLHKNGIKVVNSTVEQREEIITNYGNGLDWKMIDANTFVLYGLFGLSQMIIDEYSN